MLGFQHVTLYVAHDVVRQQFPAVMRKGMGKVD
jgi:hypothetical protein